MVLISRRCGRIVREGQRDQETEDRCCNSPPFQPTMWVYRRLIDIENCANILICCSCRTQEGFNDLTMVQVVMRLRLVPYLGLRVLIMERLDRYCGQARGQKKGGCQAATLETSETEQSVLSDRGPWNKESCCRWKGSRA